MSGQNWSIAAILFFAAFALLSCSHESQTLTVYNYTCYEDGQGYFRSESYAVYPLRQEVVGLESLSRYSKCDIYDKYNWFCRYSDGSGWLHVRDGSQVFDWDGDYAKYRSVTLSAGFIAYWLSFVVDRIGIENTCKIYLANAKRRVETTQTAKVPRGKAPTGADAGLALK